MTGARLCEVACLRIDTAGLLLLLTVDGRDVQVHVPLHHRTIHALVHRHAGQLQPRRCGAPPADNGRVDLLLRCLQVCDVRDVLLLVRPGPQAAFWLRLTTSNGPAEIDVDPVELVTLVVSDRVPVALVGPSDRWDDALAALLTQDGDGRHRSEA